MNKNSYADLFLRFGKNPERDNAFLDWRFAFERAVDELRATGPFLTGKEEIGADEWQEIFAGYTAVMTVLVKLSKPGSDKALAEAVEAFEDITSQQATVAKKMRLS